MKFHRRLFASALFLLLSPMAANATLITFTGSPFSSGRYLTAEVELSGSSMGVYSESNGGLVSAVFNLYDSGDNPLYQHAGVGDQFGSYVTLGAGGQPQNWWLGSYSTARNHSILFVHHDAAQGGTGNTYPVNQYNLNAYNINSLSIGESSGATMTSNISAGISPASASVPEPGTLALLAIGVGCMYRRRASKSRD